MKKISVLVFIVMSFAVAGCVSSKTETLSALAGEMVCLADNSVKQMQPLMNNPEKMEEKQQEIKMEIQNKIAAAGYENEKALEDALTEEKNNTQFREKTEIYVLKNCPDAGQMLDTFFQDLDNR
jgi:hypothetical protein